MSDHADVIREAMDAQCEYHGTRWSEECRTCEYQQANVAALDALVAALERGDSLLDQCGREHEAMFVRVEAAEAERESWIATAKAMQAERDEMKQAYMEQRGMREESDMRLLAADAEAAEARVTELEAALDPFVFYLNPDALMQGETWPAKFRHWQEIARAALANEEKPA